MKNIKFIICCCAMAIFALFPEEAFSKDDDAIKINLTWMYNYYWPSENDRPPINSKLNPLRRVAYKCKDLDFSGGYTVKFHDGSFYKSLPDNERVRVNFADGAFGDLNGDGKDDAAVFLETIYGGSGTLVTMAIVMNQNGKFKNTDCIVLGDREQVNSVKIKPGKVTLDMLLHLSNEPSCCPNSPLTFTFNISKEGRISNAQTFRNISDAASELSSGHMFGMRKPDKKTITHYNKAIRLYPQYEQAYLYRADALMILGRFRQAIRDFDSVLRLNPKSAEAYHGRARCYFKLKQYKMVIRDIAHTIEMEPENAYAYYLRAGAYAYLLKYKEAIGDYSLSIDKFPKMQHAPCSLWQNMFEAAYLGRAGIYAHLKDYPNAIADISKITDMAPPQEDKDYICFPEKEKYESMKGRAQTLRGKVYADLNNYKQAIKDVSVSIESDPQSESAYNARGSYYFEAEEYSLAIDDFTKALSLSKTSKRKLDNLICLASVYYQEKNFVKANQYFQKALGLEPRLRQGMKILEKRSFFYYPKMKNTVTEMTHGAL
jgi:tetratricopeptide (TPR) repeat protein